MWLRLCVAVWLACIAGPVQADELRPAVIELTEREKGAFVLEWKLPVISTRSQFAAPIAEPVIPASCTMAAAPVRRAAALALLGSADLNCQGTLAGQRFGLSELIGNADAIARFVPLNTAAQSFRLTREAPVATIAAEPSTASVMRDYLIIGAEHILFGWDHLWFVIALVLLIRSPWPVIKAATAFTIAHSITLVATSLGYAGLPSRPVEALIALSIVFLAVEVALAWRRGPESRTWTQRLPWLVAFGFGLFHGFGFAGALADIGLPQGEVAVALLAFNLGVELGQIAVIAAVVAFLSLTTRLLPKFEMPAIRCATYSIGITGSYWLIDRVIG